MNVLSINHHLELKNHNVDNIYEHDLKSKKRLRETFDYDYIIITGGDGILRRVVRLLKRKGITIPKIILNPKGSVNVIAKYYKAGDFESYIEKLENNESLSSREIPLYKIKGEKTKQYFLFSAGTSLDALYIYLSEMIRIGFMKKSAIRYLLSFIILLPAIVVLIPFLLLTKRHFFIFNLMPLPNLLNIYFKLDKIDVDLGDYFNVVQLDGDLAIVKDRYVEISKIKPINLVTS